MAPRAKPTRECVLQLLQAGYITQAEAAVLMGVTRQRVHQWVRSAGLHPTVARARHLRELLAHHAVNS